MTQQLNLGEVISNEISSIKSKHLTLIKGLTPDQLTYAVAKGLLIGRENHQPLTTISRNVGRFALTGVEFSNEEQRATAEIGCGFNLLKVLKKHRFISWHIGKKHRGAKATKRKLLQDSNYLVQWLKVEELTKLTLFINLFDQAPIQLYCDPQFEQPTKRLGFHHRVGGDLIRRINPIAKPYINKNLANPLFGAANVIRGTEFGINTDMLDLISHKENSSVRTYSDKLISEEQRASKVAADERALEVARSIGSRSFWSEVFYDFRHRLYYSMTGLNPAGSSLERSLLLLKKAEGFDLDNMKGAATAAYGEDKLSTEDRIAFFKNEWLDIDFYGSDEWLEFDDPWIFAAIIIDMRKCIEDPNYDSQVPLQIDASTSGLQVLAALVRDHHTGALCNLTDSDERSDSYIAVSSRIWSSIKVSAEEQKIWDGLKSELTRLRMDVVNGVEDAHTAYWEYINSNKELIKETAHVMWAELSDNQRKLVKRGVMTRFYNAGKSCLAEQLMDDFQGDYPYMTTHHTWWLGSMIYDTCTEVFPGAIQLMELFGQLALRAYNNGDDFGYINPTTGAFMLQHYRQNKMKRMELKDVNGKAIKLNVVIGKNEKFDYTRIKSGTAPNVVHNLDSTIVNQVILAAAEEGFDLYTIHDAFLTNSSNYNRLRELVREIFVKIFSKDILYDICEQHDSLDLYDEVEFGELELEHTITNKFCFD